MTKSTHGPSVREPAAHTTHPSLPRPVGQVRLGPASVVLYHLAPRPRLIARDKRLRYTREYRGSKKETIRERADQQQQMNRSKASTHSVQEPQRKQENITIHQQLSAKLQYLTPDSQVKKQQFHAAVALPCLLHRGPAPPHVTVVSLLVLVRPSVLCPAASRRNPRASPPLKSENQSQKLNKNIKQSRNRIEKLRSPLDIAKIIYMVS